MVKKRRKSSAGKKKSPSLKPEYRVIKKITGGESILPAQLSLITNQLSELSDLSLVTDSEAKVLECGNPARVLRCKKQIFINKDFFLFLHTDEDKNKILKSVSFNKSLTYKFSLEYSKGKIVPVLSRWTALKEKTTGKTFYFILNYVLNGINQPAETDPVKDIKGEFTWFSSSGIKDRATIYSTNLPMITGYSQTEIMRKPEGFFSIVFEEDYPAVKKSYQEFLSDKSQGNTRMIYRIEKKDKKIAWLKEIIVAERDKKGKPKTSRGTISDVSDLMKADEALVKAIDNLKKQNISKDKFISMLSHDLRAPFTSILGFAEILINEQNLSNAEKLEYLTYIHESSQNQLQLINYLLDWSRLQTGRMKIEPQRLHAQTVVFNCVSSLTGNAIRKNLEIKVNVSDKIHVQADERLLSQVITNLLSNAIKFSPPGKTIEINANIFNDELIEFIVKDEGLGISDENKDKLFKIERMFSTEGTKGEKGTGLGLSLVKEIVEKHKGDIWFYSESGEGSEFHFTIPRSPNIILLVNNNAEDKNHFEGLIKTNFPAYRIMSASSGYEAMSIVFDKLPSLVITGHEMPLMNGIQLIEAIRREEKNFSIPVILTAGGITDALKNSYYNLGVFAILEKPVNQDVFIEKLDLALRI